MIYTITESNVILNKLIGVNKANYAKHINSLCKRAYRSLSSDIKTDLNGCPEFIKSYYPPNKKATLKMKITFSGGSSSSKIAFLNALVPLLNADKKATDGKFRYHVEDGTIYGVNTSK